MLLRRFDPRSSGRTPSTINIATKVLLTLSFVILFCCLFSIPSHAQVTCGGTLACGSVTVLNTPATCSPSSGWYYYHDGGNSAYLNCSVATVSCPNTANLNVTIGYLNPYHVLSGTLGTQPPLGIIVLHGGAGGTSPESAALADAYFRAGYAIVQLAWADDWEMTYDPFPTGTFGNIQQAACRPATVLYYVYTNLLPLLNNKSAASCALGDSAGSAAVAYSLAYYGAGGWLDNVELLSGPVLSDVEQGCQVPASPSVTVCGSNGSNCQLGNGGTWTLPPTYGVGASGGVQKWTNDATCANTLPLNTGAPSQARWLAQSIVDQGTGAAPVFNYSKTSMTGWLCRTVWNVGDPPNTPPYNCQANGNNNPNYCPNNSSPQGQLFYQNVTSANTVYAVDYCVDAEGVGGGNVSGYQSQVFNGNVTGMDAITYDMVGYTPGNIKAMCVKK